MLISSIAAVSKNRVIGLEGEMPWHLSADLKWFKQTTLGHCVIMGRKTFETFGNGSPLPKRTNIIITRQTNYKMPNNCLLANNLNNALKIAHNLQQTEVFIIGGGQIYAAAMPYAHKLYLSLVAVDVPNGDTFFPEIDDKLIWHKTFSQHHPPDKKNDYPFEMTIWERLTPPPLQLKV